MRVHLIHGIHTEVVSPVQELVPLLVAAGFEVAYPDYGFIFGVETRIVNPIIRGSLLPYVDKGDVLIGHSNGCAVAYDIMQSSKDPIKGAIFINAALEPHVDRPQGVDFIDVYFNPGDETTIAAQIAQRLGIVDPVWGEMGHSGYSGNDPAITSINCGKTAGMPIVDGHSEFFLPANLKAWGPFLVSRLVKATKGA
jgi:hypothetical protein